MKKISRRGIAHGIAYTVEDVNGSPFKYLRFTDPKTKKQQKPSTKQTTVTAAHQWADEFFSAYKAGQKNGSGKLTVADLFKNVCDAYETECPDWKKSVTQRWDKRLKEKLGSIIAMELTTQDVSDYKKWLQGHKPDENSGPLLRSWQRISKPIALSTINHELSTLSKAYRIAEEEGLIPDVPCTFRRFPPSRLPRRTGFLYQWEADALMERAPDWLKPLMAVAYEASNREGELVNLKVRQCDFSHSMVRLDHIDTKSKKPRTIPMTKESKKLLLECCAGRDREDHVFTRADRNLPRRPIGDFRKIWDRLVRECGIDRKVLFHDFRRSGIRNMVDFGVERDTARSISGHLTDEVFSRYNIQNEQKQRKAAVQIAEGRKRLRQSPEYQQAKAALSAKAEQHAKDKAAKAEFRKILGKSGVLSPSALKGVPVKSSLIN